MTIYDDKSTSTTKALTTRASTTRASGEEQPNNSTLYVGKAFNDLSKVELDKTSAATEQVESQILEYHPQILGTRRQKSKKDVSHPLPPFLLSLLLFIHSSIQRREAASTSKIMFESQQKTKARIAVVKLSNLLHSQQTSRL